MLRLQARSGAYLCDGIRRRDFLHAGAIATLGLTLPGWMARKAAGAVKDRDVNCILLVLLGGPSQIDTWDPKPNAPAEIRGPFQPIATRSPGVQFTELFPRMARHTDKFSVVRSVYSTANSRVHTLGLQLMQTGRLFTGGIEHPHAGCVLGYLKGQKGEMPAHVLVPRTLGATGGNSPQGQTAGYLGKQYNPFVLNADPSKPTYKVPDLLPPDYLPAARAERRQRMREAVDGALLSFEKSPQARQQNQAFELAYRLMSSPRARAAFSLDDEPAGLRDRYGRTRFGQSCLLARRLIEGGVRFVTVNMYDAVGELNWDIHGSRPFPDINQMAKLVAPDFDQAYSTLLEDMSARGLLDSTMVIAMGEFGRTPEINPAGGRDHHTGVWSVLVAGGPLKGGRVVGESDRQGHSPRARPVTTGEVVATIYHGLGLNLRQELSGPQNRPLMLVDHDVEPISELF